MGQVERVRKNKTLSFDEEMLDEMLEYASKYSGGNFSAYVVFLHEQFKKSLKNTESSNPEADIFYKKFHENERIVKMAEKWGMNDVTFLLLLASKHYEDFMNGSEKE